MTLKAIFFDYGGTLDADGVNWQDRFYPIYQAHGVAAERETFRQAYYKADDNIDFRFGAESRDFRLAVRDRKEESHYFPVRCFGKLAESVTNIKKGARLFVAGDLELSSFVGEEGGKQVTFRVIADTYRILNGGRCETSEEPSSL